MSDPLLSLARARRQAVDEARRTLARCLDLEDAAQLRAATADTTIALETEAASLLAAGDAVVERFSVWLRRARAAAESAWREQQRAAAETARARAVLIAARAAAEAVETLRVQQAAEQNAAAARREQGELDELARHRAVYAGRTPRQLLPR